MPRQVYAHVVPEYRRRTEPIEEYMKDLKEAVNIPHYGQSPFHLAHEKKVQNAAEDVLETMQYKMLRDPLLLRTELRKLRKAIKANKERLDYLSRLSFPMEFLSRLAAKNFKWTVKLQEREWSKSFWNQDVTDLFRNTWENLEIFSMLYTFHLTKMADFHNFFYDGRKLELEFIKRSRAVITQDENKSEQRLLGTEQEVNLFVARLRNQYESLSSLAEHAKTLVIRSRQICPIYLRMGSIINPLNGVMLCNFETLECKLKAGDHVTVIANAYDSERNSDLEDTRNSYRNGIRPGSRSPRVLNKMRPVSLDPTESLGKRQKANQSYWKIQSNKQQVDCIVPSICVGLLDPDLDAREKAVTFYKVMVDTWQDFLHENVLHLVDWFKLVFNRWLKNKVQFHKQQEDFDVLIMNSRQLLCAVISSYLGVDDDELMELTNQLEAMNKDTFMSKTDVQEEMEEDIIGYNELFQWLKKHQQTINACRKNLGGFQAAVQKPLQPTFAQERAVELMHMVNKLITRQPEKATKLLNKLKDWDQTTLDDTQERIHYTVGSSDASSDLDPPEPASGVEAYRRYPSALPHKAIDYMPSHLFKPEFDHSYGHYFAGPYTVYQNGYY